MLTLPDGTTITSSLRTPVVSNDTPAPIPLTSPSSLDSGLLPLDSAPSIPQSSAPPTPFDAPSIPLDEPEDPALAQWRAESMASIQAAALDPDSALKDADLSFHSDPQLAKRLAINDAFLALHLPEGAPVPTDPMERGILRTQLAERYFSGQGGKDETEFFTAIQGQAQKQLDTTAVHNQIIAHALDSAFDPQASTWSAAREAIKNVQGYDPGQDSDYLETFLAAKQQADETFAPIKEPLRDLWRAFRSGASETAGVAALDAYSKVPEDLRPAFLDALRARARAMPAEERATFAEKTLHTTSRMLSSMAQQAGEEAATLSFPIAESISADPTNPFQSQMAGRIPEIRGEKQDFLKQRAFARQVEDIFTEDYDKITSDSMIARGLMQAPGVVLTSATMAVPYVGQAYMGAALKGWASDSLARRFEASGMDSLQAAEAADALSFPVAALQLGLEKLQFGLWANKVPGFSKFLNTIGDKVASTALRFTTKAATITAAETGIEFVQDATELVVQDAAAALSEDIPQVDWSREMDGAWTRYGEVAIAMLPLSLLGATGSMMGESRNTAFQSADPLELQAAGLSPESIAEIKEAQGPSSLSSAIDAAWTSRDPNSPEAQQAAEALQLKIQRAKQATAILEGQLRYTLPAITAAPDGTFTVRDSITREIIATAPTMGAAMKASMAHSVAMDAMSGDQMTELATLVHSGSIAAKATGVETTIDISRILDREMVEEQLGPQAAEEFAREAALIEQAEGGTGGAALTALGYNATEQRANHRQDVAHILQGGHVGTVFHEAYEAIHRRARAQGITTREDDLRLVRAFDAAFGDARTKDNTSGDTTTPGRSLRFIPEGMADEAVSDSHLREAISEIIEAQAYLLKKGEKTTRFGLSRKILAPYIGAVGRQAPEQSGKLSHFIRAIRSRFGLALARAYQIKKAQAKGDTAATTELETYLDKLTGVDVQTEHDQAVTTLATQEGYIDPSDIPFSLGRTSAAKVAQLRNSPSSLDSGLLPLASQVETIALGRSTVTPTASTRTYPTASGGLIGPATFSISAWHGTPHKVDKFTTKKIGTGEGAQAYGWGLYFAANEEVAAGYRKKLGGQQLHIDGVPYDGNNPRHIAGQALYFANNDPIAAKENIRQRIEELEKSPQSLPADQQRLLSLNKEAFNILEKDSLTVEKVLGGNLYQVNIKAEDEDLLDYDGEMTEEQIAKISPLFKGNGTSHKVSHAYKELSSGAGEAYGGGTPELASRLLASVGIRGIRFLDGNSRTKGDGSYNYVIFDEADIEILQENGQPISPSSLDSGLLPLDSPDEVGFALGRSTVAAALSQDALRRVADPLRRIQAMKRISADFQRISLAFQRTEALAGHRMSKRELRLAAAAREEMNLEAEIAQIHARYGSLLADADLTKLRAQPLHAFLSDPTSNLKGRLVSRAQAIKADPTVIDTGLYDGSELASRTLFGGTRMPDQAAQEAFDEGLIPDPTPDALWQSLAKEASFVKSMKDMMEKAKEAIREARLAAKREANEWLATQSKDQETTYNPREDILAQLRMLDAILLALPPEVRGAIGGHTQIAQIRDDRAIMSFLRDKLGKADVELEKFLKQQLDLELRDLLRRAAPKTNAPGERPTGSLDADTYDILSTAERFMGMKATEAETFADSLEAQAEAEDTSPEEALKLNTTAGLVRLFADWIKAPAARREQAVLEATSLYLGGLSRLRDKQIRRNTRLAELRKAGISGTGKTGGRMQRKLAEIKSKRTVPGFLKSAVFELVSFGELSRLLFGEANALSTWLSKRELAASNSYQDNLHAKTDLLEEELTRLAGNAFDAGKLRHRLQTDSHIVTIDALGESHNFTDTEAISFLLMWRQEDGRRHMEGQIDDSGNVTSSWAWTQQNATDLENQLTTQGKALFSFLSNQYAAEYPRINDVFRRIWNVSMPSHKNYAPLTVAAQAGKEAAITDPITGEAMGFGMTPGSLKNRSLTAVAEPLFTDALSVWLNHTRQMEHFIAYGEFARDAMQAINRREIKNSIKAVSPEAASTLTKWLDYFAQGGMRDIATKGPINNAISQGMARLSSATLVGRVSVLAMQSLQLGAALYKMPIGSFLPRFAKLLTGQLDWTAHFQSSYIQRRMREMPPIVVDAMRSLSSGSPTRLRHAAMAIGKTIPGADALFTAGTYSILYDYHLSQARKQRIENPEAYAAEQAEFYADQVAQPVRPGARSWLELSQQGSPAFRALWNFSTDPRQKLGILLYQALRHDKTGKEKAAQVAKAVAVTWAVSGVLQAILRAILRDVRNGDDDEILDDRHWNPKRLALSALTGPLGGIPFIGDMAESALFKLAGVYMPEGTLLDSVAGSIPAAKNLATGDSNDVLRDAEKLLHGASFFSGDASALASASHILRDSWNIITNFLSPDEEEE